MALQDHCKISGHNAKSALPPPKTSEEVNIVKRLLLSILLLLPFSVVAESALADADQDAKAAEAITKRLLEARPDIPILDIQPTQMPGMYAVTLPGGQLLHFSADGQFFFPGDLYQVTDQLVNITEQGRAGARKELIDGLDESQMVVFSPAKERVKATITVFTDIDCVFCRKLHNEVPEMNRLGIAVRYLAFPRSGKDTPSYDKLVSAWCSENPQIALTRAKAGEQIPDAKCVNPVASQLELVQQLGINSTPAVVFEDGTLTPGYRTAAEFAQILGVL